MEILEVTPSLRIPLWEIETQVSRSSGPGGQHVNKTSSRVSVRWCVLTSGALSEHRRAWLLQRLAPRLTQDGWLVIHADDTRSQHQNREIALERLAALVRQALARPKARVATRPSKAARKRRLDGKQRRSQLKASRRRPGFDD